MGAAPVRSAGHRLRALPGRHRLFTGLFLAGLLLRVLTTMAYWPAIGFVQDSFDHLHEARNLEPGIIRPFGYPLLLAGCRSPGSSPSYPSPSASSAWRWVSCSTP